MIDSLSDAIMVHCVSSGCENAGMCHVGSGGDVTTALFPDTVCHCADGYTGDDCSEGTCCHQQPLSLRVTQFLTDDLFLASHNVIILLYLFVKSL